MANLASGAVLKSHVVHIGPTETGMFATLRAIQISRDPHVDMASNWGYSQTEPLARALDDSVLPFHVTQ